ncbi:PP2C-domain-containing protein [Schizophyllum commune Tattone D]|nr:PP2C-domain-containing protein [Schizophyllum commune Tattone D]
MTATDTMTTTAVTLDMMDMKGVLDRNGRSVYGPDVEKTAEISKDTAEIAPWLMPDEAPAPPPKHSVSKFGFHSKSSFNVLRPTAGSSSSRPSRTSESLSTVSIAESTSTHDSQATSSSSSPPDLRKKSSGFMNLSFLKKRSSKPALRRESDDHPSLRPPPPPLPDRILSTDTPPSSFLSASPPSSITSRTRRKRSKQPSISPAPPPHKKDKRDGDYPEFGSIDTNFENMDGIIDLSRTSGTASTDVTFNRSFDANAPDYHANLRQPPAHHRYLGTHTPLSFEDFINPFSPAAQEHVAKRKPYDEGRKVSPTTVLPVGPDSPSWTPPESWAVEKEGVQEEADFSSSDDGAGPSASAPPTVPSSSKHKRRKRKTLRPAPKDQYKIRIYRPDNKHHVVLIGYNVTVANLIPALQKKANEGVAADQLATESLRSDDAANIADMAQNKLYLKERGRERVLAPSERPADILKRRLEMAGYEPTDGINTIGEEDLSFLLKFGWKTQVLGPAEEDLVFDNFEYVDLTARSLRTIPVVLHKNADSIHSLKLSRNPMLEIPLDFIQSCTTLRELRLSNMAIKKVPHSVRHSKTLQRLDLSSNRIADLDDAYLSEIPDLMALFVQNNRMERLPWHFPRLRNLVTLNISNNKFNEFPTAVTQLVQLQDLDISFNMISELPEELGKLTMLGRLIIVGNQVSRLPDGCARLRSLRVLDCRRNQISDFTVVCNLPRLETLSADHNAVHALDLSLGPCVANLDASHNEITQLSLLPGPIGRSPVALTSLDLSHAKLALLDEHILAELTSLRVLRLDHNSIRMIPEALGELEHLEVLSCSDSYIVSLPSSIGRLQNLVSLDVHNNSLKELPVELWHCGSLARINVTSNLIKAWPEPPVFSTTPVLALPSNADARSDRKASVASLGAGRCMPPLAQSLQKLYAGENQLTYDALPSIACLRELQVLNLSFNDIQDMPSSFFRTLTKLEELYLSGNMLTSIPTEDLPKLTRLKTLFLNGNRLQTLPQELAKVKSLMALDVGSNLLKYNINNWEFDWNWNFNKNLKYLNLSGNKKLQIKSDTRAVRQHNVPTSSLTRQSLAGFTDLHQLRFLGLMDVTITPGGMHGGADIPDENDDRRVRTSVSTVSGMAYGIADTLGSNEQLNMIDLVHDFRRGHGEAVFAMFGRAQPPKTIRVGTSSNRLAKFLQDNFIRVFRDKLDDLARSPGDDITDALRRTFLRLNQELHDSLVNSHRKMSTHSGSGANNPVIDPDIARTGASGLVLYFKDRTLYVANCGNALAVISKQGIAQPVSRKHDPYDRAETARIRAAEGWISPPGLVNDEIDISRSFGFFHLLPVVNARPDVHTYHLDESDEFVIVANRGLWDYVSYQTAVDIARSEWMDTRDPMIVAMKLRDFAISYGAEGSTMIMVIGVTDLLSHDTRQRQATMDSIPEMSGLVGKRTRRKDDVGDRDLARLDGEVEPPTGNVTLVFTDIRNSTHLWEANPGMRSAMIKHNALLRRHLRLCGGYEVKTEGDAFMCAFTNPMSALWWCLVVQRDLLREDWPLEILECEDGKLIYDVDGKLVARGLSVRMGLHCGHPLCERDPITNRMDYFGSIVNRASRISGSAAGGQIMCSADVIRELNASVHRSEPPTEYTDLQPAQAVNAIRQMEVAIVPVGERKLKGLEVPEMLSIVYPKELQARQFIEEMPEDPGTSGSRIQFSIDQMRELGMLCLRLETIASERVFRALPERKGSFQPVMDGGEPEELNEPSSSVYYYGDPSVLLPQMSDKLSDRELMSLLDFFSVRIENALSTIQQRHGARTKEQRLTSALAGRLDLDERTLQEVLALLQSV